MGRVAEAKRQQLEEILRELVDRIWHLMADSHEKGKRWESEVQNLAEARSLTVEPGESRGDLKINGRTVQCKHIDASRSGDTLDIANMRPVVANGGHRGYLAGEYDVLALRHQEHVYLIPAECLKAGDGTLLGRVRLSEIERFRDAWCVFGHDYTPPRRTMQLELTLGEDAKDGI